MTNEERIAANAAKGYIQIYESDGWAIYKKLNEVGGWTYYSDRIGNEGAYIIWDSTVRSEEELRAILEDILKPEVNGPEPLKTLLELNAMIGRLQAYVNNKLEQNL